MACPKNRAMNRGSGYVKPSTGDTELNNKMSQLLAERDAQIATIFPPLVAETHVSNNNQELDSKGRMIELAIYSYALDRYVTPKHKTFVLLKKLDDIIDWEFVHTEVDKFVQDQPAVQSYTWSQNRLRLSTYYEVAKLTQASWGACAVHVFL
jgi:hypothetical protein